MNRRLLVLYPRVWRERYGAEVVDLAEELVGAGETTPLRAAAGLVAGAAVERCRVLAGWAVPLPVIVAGGVALAAHRGRPGGTRPYFFTHRVGVLVLVAEVVWLAMEVAEWWRGRRSRRLRDRDTRTGQRRFRLAVGACVVAGTAAVELGPAVVPAAQIRPGALAFAAGMVMLAAGLGLRACSFRALRGRYLNFSVVVRPDQPLVTAGPYRLLRHPGNAGLLLICAGIGATSANWTGLAVMTLLPLAVVVRRIRAEEETLLAASLAASDDVYRRYAAGHQRLIPWIW
ncbi:MAG: hypothetical protein V7637_5180 [Mycobacteriales bacterium]|jgi:protein-S-isoprenylcysteine O-methyltransferase Ste14